jgi:hypothetical protein
MWVQGAAAADRGRPAGCVCVRVLMSELTGSRGQGIERDEGGPQDRVVGACAGHRAESARGPRTPAADEGAPGSCNCPPGVGHARLVPTL